jgi:hypothetical protein
MSWEFICKAAEWSAPLACSAGGNLGIVVFGGVIGGLLQPIYSRLHPDHPNPTGKYFLWSALLGLAAAGISVYVVANSKQDDAIRLLFFSLLCGLAFPSVLTSAVNSIGKHTAEVKENVEQIAEKARSNDAEQTAQAADQLKTALARNPVGAIDAKGVSGVDAVAQIAVQNIAETAKADSDLLPAVINQLQQVGTIARAAGYTGTVETAATELSKLGLTQDDGPIKSSAEHAAEGLRGN